MENFNSLSVDNNAVKWAMINNRLVYSALSDKSEGVAVVEGAILSTATSLSAASYTCPNGTSYNYNQLSTFIEHDFTGAGSGNARPWAASPYVMVTAEHYKNNIPMGAVTIGGVSVTRTASVNLKTWAKASGKWSDKYIDDLTIDDIQLVTLDKSGNAIPDAALPWFCSWPQFQAMFHTDKIDGMVGWTSPQILFDGTKQAAPVVFVSEQSNSREIKWTIPKLALNLLDPELSAAYDVGNTYLAQSGDSGRPVYFVYDGKPVIVSHYHAVEVPAFSPVAPYYGVGPNYMKALDILREFVIEYEGANTLKELEVTE